MAERPIRVAVVGCGWAGGRHARAYDRLGAAIRWAADTGAERAAALAAGRPGCRAATDYREALADPEVDAVDICLPHALHADAAVAAARAGKHVLCEKPLAGTLADADRMIAAADEAGVALMVAENARFDPRLLKVRELLDEGVIGRPALAQIAREAYLTRSFLAERPWFLDARAAAGGIMMSGGVHDFETLRMLIGEVETVYALRARQRFAAMEGDDTSVALVRFANGAAGTLVESFVMKSLTTAAGPEVHTLRIDGDLGSIALRADGTIRVFSERADLALAGAPTAHDLSVPAGDGFTPEIAHFLRAVRTGEEPLTSGRSQRRPLELVLAAYRSMETGRAVRVG
jgi:predicted dehydrogenase